MHNYNVGNVKTSPGTGYDFQYFTCTEHLPYPYALKICGSDLSRVRILEILDNGYCLVQFKPYHSACCFQAFETLFDGVLSHLSVLSESSKFSSAWSLVVNGDPVGFSKALRASGYYTSKESDYTAGILSLFEEYSRTITLTSDPSKECPQAVSDVLESLRKCSDEILAEMKKSLLEETV